MHRGLPNQLSGTERLEYHPTASTKHSACQDMLTRAGVRDVVCHQVAAHFRRLMHAYPAISWAELGGVALDVAVVAGLHADADASFVGAWRGRQVVKVLDARRMPYERAEPLCWRCQTTCNSLPLLIPGPMC